MTDQQLTGRDPDLDLDLDRACALAMGFLPYDEHEHLRTDSGIPRYGSDPATLDEKLAWLAERNAFDIRFRYRAAAKTVHAIWFLDNGDEQVINGATIHEATARLIVAVAAQEKP